MSNHHTPCIKERSAMFDMSCYKLIDFNIPANIIFMPGDYLERTFEFYSVG